MGKMLLMDDQDPKVKEM